jgi:hypothetical protein
MNTEDGDPYPFTAPTPPQGTRLVRVLFLAGTIVLSAVAVLTFPVPGTPSLADMDEATASAPVVVRHCRTTWVGSVASESCHLTLRLDDGKKLKWPWATSRRSSGDVGKYLRANGPITVRFWNESLYQIELHDGDVYLAYGDAYDADHEKQWIGVILGFFVAAISLIRIELELRYLRDPINAARAGELGADLGLVCLGGALLVAAAATHRMWIGVVGLALFAALAPTYDQKIIRRAQACALAP